MVSRKEIEIMKKKYINGSIVKLFKMHGENKMPRGLIGVISHVDNTGKIHVSWKNGSSLALIPSIDKFKLM